ncbi:probable methyltransferase PMT5 isoform X1 [Aristolochia californica]|uniref:probable methyltransferase PMT5 isoform X1 n=1 Tax=Aristolochia californica TaxID=171875 RepID=UPI0035D7FF5A
MRSQFSHQPFINVGRSPPFSWILLLFLCFLALIAILSSSPSKTLESVVSTPLPNIYKSYRKLREQAASEVLEIRSLSLGITQPRELDICGKGRENHVPCYNVSGNLLAGFHNGEEFDRHCEVSGQGVRCLIRPPKEYKIPLRWPAGRDVIWKGNVKLTKDQFLNYGTMTKRLMLLEENQIAFHSEDGTIFYGVKEYSRQVAEMLGLASDSELNQAGVRTVLDIGCGFGSFGAHLMSLNVTTTCIAAYEMYGSQVQLTLERGLPALIGNFISRQLPFPSLSFDMIHCAQCGIVWDAKEGAFLVEVDRLLKPGGYFVLTSPVTQQFSVGPKHSTIFEPLEEIANKICWTLKAQQDESSVWQKTAHVDCYAFRKQTGVASLCKNEDDLESYYHYQPLRSCLSGVSSKRWAPIQNRSHVHNGYFDFQCTS